MKQILVLMVGDYLERFGPERCRTFLAQDGSALVRYHERLGENGEWELVSEDEYDAWIAKKHIAIDDRMKQIRQLLQTLEKRQ